MLGLTALVWYRYCHSIETYEPKGLTISNKQKDLITSHFEPHNERYGVYLVNNKTTFTAYTLSVDETDENNCIGAGNNNICELRKTRQICASRDLPLNTLIYIQDVGECVIKDRMNIRYKGTNTVDILMETKSDAINFGKRELNYVIIK